MTASPLTREDIEQIVEGIERFVMGAGWPESVRPPLSERLVPL
jgi:hypothetical protein